MAHPNHLLDNDCRHVGRRYPSSQALLHQDAPRQVLRNVVQLDSQPNGTDRKEHLNRPVELWWVRA